jgi:hypothetical protein
MQGVPIQAGLEIDQGMLRVAGSRLVNRWAFIVSNSTSVYRCIDASFVGAVPFRSESKVEPPSANISAVLKFYDRSFS